MVQRYIDKPLLLDGLKFDLRVYIVLVGIGEGLKAYICDEGLARFCTVSHQTLIDSYRSNTRNRQSRTSRTCTCIWQITACRKCQQTTWGQSLIKFWKRIKPQNELLAVWWKPSKVVASTLTRSGTTSKTLVQKLWKSTFPCLTMFWATNLRFNSLKVNLSRFWDLTCFLMRSWLRGFSRSTTTQASISTLISRSWVVDLKWRMMTLTLLTYMSNHVS